MIAIRNAENRGSTRGLLRRLISPFIFLLLFSSCATSALHKPLPEGTASQVVVPGFPASIRFWADEDPRYFDFDTIVNDRISAYLAANAAYFQKYGTYPPLYYLAISGGGDDGAFSAGLLSGWSDSGTRPDFEIVTGVSTGALIAPFVFIGSKYDPAIRKLFTTTNSNAVFMSSFWDVLIGFTGGLAITDSSPLAKKIKESITPEIMAEVAAEHRKGKRLFIGTTNMEAQRGVIWDIGAIANIGGPDALNLIHQVMLASASVPGVFRPVFISVEVNGKQYNEIHADGSVTSQVFVYPMKIHRSIVDKFLRFHLERHLYIVRNGKITPEYRPLQPSFFSLSRRSIEMLTKYEALGDLFRLYASSQRDEIDYNLIYIPDSFTEKSKEPFDPSYMSKLFDVGYDLGKRQDAWIKKPPGLQYVEPE